MVIFCIAYLSESTTAGSNENAHAQKRSLMTCGYGSEVRESTTRVAHCVGKNRHEDSSHRTKARRI